MISFERKLPCNGHLPAPGDPPAELSYLFWLIRVQFVLVKRLSRGCRASSHRLATRVVFPAVPICNQVIISYNNIKCVFFHFLQCVELPAGLKEKSREKNIFNTITRTIFSHVKGHTAMIYSSWKKHKGIYQCNFLLLKAHVLGDSLRGMHFLNVI